MGIGARAVSRRSRGRLGARNNRREQNADRVRPSAVPCSPPLPNYSPSSRGGYCTKVPSQITASPLLLSLLHDLPSSSDCRGRRCTPPSARRRGPAGLVAGVLRVSVRADRSRQTLRLFSCLGGTRGASSSHFQTRPFVALALLPLGL